MAIRKKTLPTKWGKRSIENLNNWEDVDINNFSSDKPIVICLSGNGALNAKHANGFCKRASKFLELLLKDRNSNKQVSELVDIIGCSYGYNARIEIPDMETEEQKAEFFKKYPTIPDYIKEYPNKISYDSYGKISEEELDDFVDRVLLPLITDTNGQILYVEDAQKNLSRVTFFTWCHGAREATLMQVNLAKKCLKLGYDMRDVVELFKSCFHISYAPSTTSNFSPGVRIDSLQDYMNIGLSELMPDLNGINIELEPSDAQKKAHFENIHIWSSKLTNKDNADINEHSVEYLDRDKFWEVVGGHENADAVSQMMAWALCRAVENSFANMQSDTYVPKKPLSELMTELVGIKEDFSEEQLMS